MMAMIKAGEFRDMTEGTIIWSAYSGRITMCTFNSVASTPGIWGNFPDDFAIDIDGPGMDCLRFGPQCSEFYLCEIEAKQRALAWELESRQSQLDRASEMLAKAQARMDSPLMVEVEDGL